MKHEKDLSKYLEESYSEETIGIKQFFRQIIRGVYRGKIDEETKTRIAHYKGLHHLISNNQKEFYSYNLFLSVILKRVVFQRQTKKFSAFSNTDIGYSFLDILYEYMSSDSQMTNIEKYLFSITTELLSFLSLNNEYLSNPNIEKMKGSDFYISIDDERKFFDERFKKISTGSFEEIGFLARLFILSQEIKRIGDTDIEREGEMLNNETKFRVTVIEYFFNIIKEKKGA